MEKKLILMNIFYLDHNIQQCVQYHCDRHVVKMILEYAQLLSTAHHILGTKLDISTLYRKTHINHPSNVWVRSSKQNYLWLYNLFCSLCGEYTFRYGKIHTTDKKLRSLLSSLPFNINNDKFTQPTQAMPDDCKNDDSIVAYRTYYMKCKRHIATWKNRPIPKWYK